MSITIPTRILMSLLFALAVALVALPAGAQEPGEMFVTVDNDEERAIPVYPAGRVPYQMAYGLYARSGSVADCKRLPVPPGMRLTVTSIGVTTNVAREMRPDVYLTVGRSRRGGGAAYRHREPLTYVRGNDRYRVYRGTYHPGTVVGPTETDEDVRYSGSICVAAAPGSIDFANTARGIVTGYLEPGLIVDGDSLLEQQEEEEEPASTTSYTAPATFGFTTGSFQ